MLTANSFYDKYNETALVVDQAGKGKTVDAFSNSAVDRVSSVGIKPKSSLTDAIRYTREDETLSGAIETLVSSTVGNGFYVRSKNKQLLKKAEKRLADRKFTSSVLVPMLSKLFPLGNSFVEVVSSDEDGKPWCYVVETSQVEIMDPEGYGVPSGYVQRAGSKADIMWTPDEMVHFKLSSADTALWADVPVASLRDTLLMKGAVIKHVRRLFDKNAFRSVLDFPANTVEEDVNRSMSEYALAARDPNRPYVWFGGVKQSVLQSFEDGPRFIELINLCDHAILVKMQVPPIMAGIPDASGRASGEQQTNKAFNTYIRYIHSMLEEVITNELFPKMGFGGVTFHFNEIDKKSEKDVLEMAVQLKALGAKPDKLSGWLSGQGIEVDEDFFDPAFYEAPSKADKDALTNKTAASRQGANGSRKSVGTGSESSTRQNQVVTQSLDDEIESAMKRLHIEAIVGDEE